MITAYNGGAPIPYTAPKTPWGEPDLQGVWSSDDTAGIPRERPAELGNAALSDRRGVGGAAEAGGRRRPARRERRRLVPQRLRHARVPADVAHRRSARRPAARASRPRPRSGAPSRDRGTFGNGPFNTFEDFTLYDRCITRGIVGSVLRVVYGNGNRIVQAPGMVAFSYEMIHDTRVLYTDGRPHLSQNIRQYLGDSRARWEGDELVVETTNLTDKTSIGGNGNGLRHSDRMTITERFKRVADDVVQYQFTVDDPVTYKAPFTMSMPLTPLVGRRDPALRVPRGQRRGEELAQRRTRRGRGARRRPGQGHRRARVAGAGRRPRPAAALPAAPRPAEEN